MTAMYEDRVSRGAALLDRVRPGWAAEIDTDRLYIMDGRYCVLGQLYGNYTIGRDVVRRWLPWWIRLVYSPARYGFIYGTIYLFSRDSLTESWCAAIRERVEAKEGASV